MPAGGIDLPGVSSHSAQGTWLQREVSPGAGVYETVSRLRNIRGPNFSVNDQDVTSHDSDQGIKQYNAGMIDLGEMTADQFYLPESQVQQRMEADAYAKAVTSYRLLIRSKSVTLGYRQGNAYVKTLGDQFPSDGGMMQRNIGIRLTGPWPYVPGDPPS